MKKLLLTIAVAFATLALGAQTVKVYQADSILFEIADADSVVFVAPPVSEIGPYYIWSADAVFDDDEEVIVGGTAYTLLYEKLVNGFEESDISSIMTACSKGDIIHENEPTAINGYGIVMVDEQNIPTMLNSLGIQVSYKYRTSVNDVNDKTHYIYTFPLEVDGPLPGEKYKTLTIN